MNIRDFQQISDATRQHQLQHDCSAYSFSDGRSLARLITCSKPRRILELGTALGFSSCVMANAAPEAIVDSIDISPEHLRLAQQNIIDHGLEHRIRLHQGLFGDVIERLPSGYDIAFFDGHAPDQQLLQKMEARLCINGLLICANLNLNSQQERRNIMAFLDDPKRWRIAPSLEHGQTHVRQKV